MSPWKVAHLLIPPQLKTSISCGLQDLPALTELRCRGMYEMDKCHLAEGVFNLHNLQVRKIHSYPWEPLML